MSWGTNTQAELAVTLPGASESGRLPVPIDNPKAWLSAVIFLGVGTNVQPDSLDFHVVNRTPGPLRLEACRLTARTDGTIALHTDHPSASSMVVELPKGSWQTPSPGARVEGQRVTFQPPVGSFEIAPVP